MSVDVGVQMGNLPNFDNSHKNKAENFPPKLKLTAAPKSFGPQHITKASGEKSTPLRRRSPATPSGEKSKTLRRYKFPPQCALLDCRVLRSPRSAGRSCSNSRCHHHTWAMLPGQDGCWLEGWQERHTFPFFSQEAGNFVLWHRWMTVFPFLRACEAKDEEKITIILAAPSTHPHPFQPPL